MTLCGNGIWSRLDGNDTRGEVKYPAHFVASKTNVNKQPLEEV